MFLHKLKLCIKLKSNDYVQVIYSLIYEPRHDETNKMSVRLAKTQISLGNG